MKISPNKKLIFKGYSAGKIKTLYMQNTNFPSQINIYNKMKEIGEKEGFDVFIHSQGEIKKEEIKSPDKNKVPWSLWSQDNKIFIKKDNRQILLTPEFYNPPETLAVKDFCNASKIKGFVSEIIFEGGNMYFGKKDNGENYLMTSMPTLYLSGKYLYLKEKTKKDLTYKEAESFFVNGKFKNENGETIATNNEYEKDYMPYIEKAVKIISQDFDIKKENLIILPETNFHIDMAIRPLEYPYVLVNDDKEVDKLIKKLEKKFKFDFGARKDLKALKRNVKKHRTRYCSTEKVCQKLEEKGFVPIKIAGAFGRSPVNFINAIVQKTNNGLTYITNSTKPSTKLYEAMQDIFEQNLRENCPNISKVYFIDGGIKEKNRNNIMYYLENGNGGIHCLCCEEME